jgi:hypothetical protein
VVMKTPSTPKAVKKVCRLRVSRKGTCSQSAARLSEGS